jgi:PmbA protein
MTEHMTAADVVELCRKLGADDAVAQLFVGNTTQVKFANSAIAITQNWSEASLNVFVACRKRTASVTLEDLDHLVVRSSIERLLKIAKASQPNKDWAGLARGPFSYAKPKDTFDKNLVDTDKAADWVNAAIAATGAPKAAGVLYLRDTGHSLATSGGVHAEDRGTSAELSIRAFFEKDESGHAVSTSCTKAGFNPEAAGRKAGEIAKAARKPQPGQAGKFDVIFDPLAFADLLSVVASSASAYNVDAGYSFLAGKLGKPVANPSVTLLDDPTAAGGLGSIPFDDEGRPTQRTAVIEGGQLKTYLHNTSTAKKFNASSTASAGLIAPQPRNVILQPGNASKDALFKQVKDGIYVSNIWYTRFQNYRTGDFSTIPRDGLFIIRNGELWRSVKGLRITDNLQRILENIVALSSKPETMLWWGMEYQVPVNTPYVLVKGVNITKPTM